MVADLNVAIGAAIVIVLSASAIFAPFLAPYDPLAIDATAASARTVVRASDGHG